MQSLGNQFHIHLLGDHAILIKLSKGLNEGIDQDLLALAAFIKEQKIESDFPKDISLNSTTNVIDRKNLLYEIFPSLYNSYSIKLIICESLCYRITQCQPHKNQQILLMMKRHLSIYQINNLVDCRIYQSFQL